jgi:hypothetical protein
MYRPRFFSTKQSSVLQFWICSVFFVHVLWLKAHWTSKFILVALSDYFVLLLLVGSAAVRGGRSRRAVAVIEVGVASMDISSKSMAGSRHYPVRSRMS